VHQLVIKNFDNSRMHRTNVKKKNEIILMWSAYSQIVLVDMVGDAPSHCHWVCGYDFKAKSTFMSLQLTNQQLMKPTPHSHASQSIVRSPVDILLAGKEISCCCELRSSLLCPHSSGTGRVHFTFSCSLISWAI